MSLILFAHGARDVRWCAPFEHLREKIAEQMPGQSVRLAFLELMSPSLLQAVGEEVALGARQIHIAPLFLAAGNHLRQDLPVLLADIKQQHPELALHLLPVLGEIEAVQDAIATAYTKILC